MSHKRGCQCDICLRADELEKSKKPKKSIPRHVLEEWKEKRAKQEDIEILKGIMEIQCPVCRHYFKTKIGPVIFCDHCGSKIQ